MPTGPNLRETSQSLHQSQAHQSAAAGAGSASPLHQHQRSSPGLDDASSANNASTTSLGSPGAGGGSKFDCNNLTESSGTTVTHQQRHKTVQTHQSSESVKWIQESEAVYSSELVQQHSARRCCRTPGATSSGYSSHSPPPPPQPAASYVNCAPSPSAGLPVIREGDGAGAGGAGVGIRSVWPAYEMSDSTTSDEEPMNEHLDGCGTAISRQRTSPVSSCSCSCDGGSSSDYGPAPSHHHHHHRQAQPLSAREVLLELSRTLSSVLEGDCGKSDDEILRDITRTVAQGQDFQRRSLYEEIYRNSSLSSNSKDSSSTIAVNPINSRVYGQRCYCESSKPASATGFARQNSVRFSPKVIEHREKCPPTVFLLPDDNYGRVARQESGITGCADCSGLGRSNKYENLPPRPPANKILKRPSSSSEQLDAGGAGIKTPDKDGSMQMIQGKSGNGNEYANAAEHEYTTLECSDESSSSDYPVNGPGSGAGGKGSNSSSWCQDFRGFDKNLDFTLDGLRAERLGRAIARAKRRRQWCRVILVILGFVFFILSCVTVSLAVTRGRKAFGSM